MVGSKFLEVRHGWDDDRRSKATVTVRGECNCCNRKYYRQRVYTPTVASALRIERLFNRNGPNTYEAKLMIFDHMVCVTLRKEL